MGKGSRLRFIQLLLFSLLLTTSLFSSANILKKAEVRNKELRLVFNSWLNTKNIKKMTLNNPPRVVIDIKNARLEDSSVGSNLSCAGVRSFRISQYKRDIIRIVIETGSSYRCHHYQPMSSRSFYHISLPKKSSTSIASVMANDENYQTPQKPYAHKKTTKLIEREERIDKEVSFFPALFSSGSKGTKKSYIVVIDAGHGGSDSGAVGAGRYYEKVVVLQIAKRVGKYLKDKGHKVIMTRTNDRFIELKNRTKFANRYHADIFVSIHANAVSKAHRRDIVHGIETYYLQKTRSARSKRVAALENSVVLDKNDRLSQDVILNAVLSGPKLVESNKLAIDIQSRMLNNVRSNYRGVRDGGVKPAPFWVLVGAQMPSVLVEVGYITHPKERARIFTADYQKRLAKGIAEGISNYLVNHERALD
jgi:N-acetylmuramoyl-L-alanine amidase